MKTLVEFAADYISNQADRGYLTEASQRVQRMVDSCNKKVKKDADPLKGHTLEYDGERVHVVHPKKGVVGSFKPYAGIDTEGMLYSARRKINPRRDSDDNLPPGWGVQQLPNERRRRGGYDEGEFPGHDIHQFPKGMKLT